MKVKIIAQPTELSTLKYILGKADYVLAEKTAGLKINNKR
jgi:hypothetical protein